MHLFRKLTLLVLVVFSVMLLSVGCSSKGKADSPESNGATQNEVKETPKASESENEKNTVATDAPEEKTSEPQKSETVYSFEGDLQNWFVSDWKSDNDGELAFTGAKVSADQKLSGSSSSAIDCKFVGKPGSSQAAKGAFKAVFENPIDLSGKVISANIYVPESLFTQEFVENSLGAKIYIKTTDNWTWSDGGWVNIATDMKPGWNKIIFAPIGVKEKQTKEIGIHISKGDNSPDWSGTIYIDDISY